MKTIRILALPMIAILALSACETIEGAGKDLQDAGAAVSEEARETQADM